MIVDTREPPEMHAAAFAASDDYERDKLGAGDFLAGQYLIERKRYADFVDRLTQNENDIWTQLGALNAACEENDLKPALILDGPWAETLEMRNVSEKAVMGAIETVPRMGIEVVPTFDKDATAYVVDKRAARFGGDHKASPASIRDAPDVPPAKRPRYLVEGLPAVGPALASRLLDHFVSAGGVFRTAHASPEKLTNVDGIGEKKARRIAEAVTA
jgi:Fanconi anemia group M protein